jgi:hypothetical protein
MMLTYKETDEMIKKAKIGEVAVKAYALFGKSPYTKWSGMITSPTDDKEHLKRILFISKHAPKRFTMEMSPEYTGILNYKDVKIRKVGFIKGKGWRVLKKVI